MKLTLKDIYKKTGTKFRFISDIKRKLAVAYFIMKPNGNTHEHVKIARVGDGAACEFSITDQIISEEVVLVQDMKLGMARLLTEAAHLLSIHSPQSCPRWKEGIGDCEGAACEFCRANKCIDKLLDKATELKDEIKAEQT